MELAPKAHAKPCSQSTKDYGSFAICRIDYAMRQRHLSVGEHPAFMLCSLSGCFTGAWGRILQCHCELAGGFYGNLQSKLETTSCEVSLTPMRNDIPQPRHQHGGHGDKPGESISGKGKAHAD